MERATTGFLVWRVALKFRASVDRAVAGLGLTHAQYSLLASLYGMSRSGAAPSQRELADHTGLDPIFVSKLARALEQAGLVTRATHRRDPRAVELTLTEHGITTVRKAIGLVHELQKHLLAPIGGPGSPRDRVLVEILRDLLDGAGEEEKGESP
jgi:MarR family transcriptional regulator, organic hydroperoxide resistance regulator